MEEASDRKTASERRNQIVAWLDGLVDELESSSTRSSTASKIGKVTNDVFLVHGRNVAAKERTARFLEKLGLSVAILHERPDGGQTIIEKFERFSQVRFAVVLLTADDHGGPQDKLADLRPRARQNVVFEHGYFVGVLGRSRVCALCDPSVELPSDLSGVLYIPLDEGDAWKLSLAKELKAGGLEVDLNQAVT